MFFGTDENMRLCLYILLSQHSYHKWASKFVPKAWIHFCENFFSSDMVMLVYSFINCLTILKRSFFLISIFRTQKIAQHFFVRQKTGWLFLFYLGAFGRLLINWLVFSLTNQTLKIKDKFTIHCLGLYLLNLFRMNS